MCATVVKETNWTKVSDAIQMPASSLTLQNIIRGIPQAPISRSLRARLARIEFVAVFSALLHITSMMTKAFTTTISTLVDRNIQISHQWKPRSSLSASDRMEMLWGFGVSIASRVFRWQMTLVAGRKSFHQLVMPTVRGIDCCQPRSYWLIARLGYNGGFGFAYDKVVVALWWSRRN